MPKSHLESMASVKANYVKLQMWACLGQTFSAILKQTWCLPLAEQSKVPSETFLKGTTVFQVKGVQGNSKRLKMEFTTKFKKCFHLH